MESLVWHSKPDKVLYCQSLVYLKLSTASPLGSQKLNLGGHQECSQSFPNYFQATKAKRRLWQTQNVRRATQLEVPQDLWLEKRKRTGHHTHPLAGPPSLLFPSRRLCLYWKQRGENIVSSQICWASWLKHWTRPRWPLCKGLISHAADKTKAGDRRQLRRKHLPNSIACNYLALVEEKHWKETAEKRSGNTGRLGDE